MTGLDPFPTYARHVDCAFMPSRAQDNKRKFPFPRAPSLFLSLSLSLSLCVVFQKMIGALTSSASTKISFEDCPRGLFRCGTKIFCLFPRKTFNIEFLRFDSAQTRIPKPLRSSFPPKASQVDLSAAETQTQEKYLSTVHVRFQLQKECAFGEHFFILGDDPVFGLWDPVNAIPLNWSDGHVWTVDLDLPVGKSIEFKFILKGKTGNILWQPGQNRVVETWETSSTITICEDWENADLRNIFEEELVLVNQEGQESPVVKLDMPVVAENAFSAHSKEKVELNTNNSSIVQKEAEVFSNSIEENPAAMVAENVGYIKDDSEEGLSSDAQNERKIDESPFIFYGSGTEVVMVMEEGCSVLVPGLAPVPSSFEEEEDMTGEGGEEEASTADDDASGEVVVNHVGETDNSPPERDTKEEREEGEGQEVKEEEEERRHVMEKDIQWGRRTLHKLLNSFRLL